MSRRVKSFAKMFGGSALLMCAICSSCWGQEQKPQVIMGLQNPPPVSFSGDLPPGPMQNKATTACTECHEARIILQQRLSKAAWTKEVDKMIKWGALVEAGDHDALIDYLSTHFNPEQPPYIAPRTAAEKEVRKSPGSKN
jgi:hypothetical protein